MGQTRAMRILSADDAATDASPGSDVDEATLDALYAHDGPLLRRNFVTPLDGAATGSDGLSGLSLIKI